MDVDPFSSSRVCPSFSVAYQNQQSLRSQHFPSNVELGRKNARPREKGLESKTKMAQNPANDSLAILVEPVKFLACGGSFIPTLRCVAHSLL
jgi:hypothetical protein